MEAGVDDCASASRRTGLKGIYAFERILRSPVQARVPVILHIGTDSGPGNRTDG